MANELIVLGLGFPVTREPIKQIIKPEPNFNTHMIVLIPDQLLMNTSTCEWGIEIWWAHSFLLFFIFFKGRWAQLDKANWM